MPTSDLGNPSQRAGPGWASGGFTLIELLVVIAIVAVASAGVGLAMRDAGQVQLAREADRLAALLESARARSRASGVPLQWRTTADGFQFEVRSGATGFVGATLPAAGLPQQWLDPDTAVASQASALGNAGVPVLVLGPDPIIGPQSVVLMSTSAPDQRVRLATDGVRPFAVQPDPL